MTMICPECHNGLLPDPTPNRARNSQDYGKVVLCERCNGSGDLSLSNKEAANKGNPILSKRSSSKDADSLVA